MSECKYVVISRSPNGPSATVKAHGRILYFEDYGQAQAFAIERMRKMGGWLYYVKMLKREK